MKWVGIAVAVLVALVGIVVVVGLLLPRDHVASSAITLTQPADSVWAVVRDLGATPSWWRDVKQSTRLDDRDGRERWEQKSSTGVMPLEIAEERPPTRLVTRIASPPGAAFGGSWIYEITPVAGGSRITVTEDGWIANPIFRFMAYGIFGLHGTLDAYLRALGRRFGQDVEPTHLARGAPGR